jgi:transposase
MALNGSDPRLLPISRHDCMNQQRASTTRKTSEMSMLQKEPLRPLTVQATHELQRVVKASSERVDTVRRARAVLALADGQSFTQAAAQAGFKEADSLCTLVRRFHRTGLAALCIAAGRGRKATYTSQQRQGILEELRREPDREGDQSATWSLSLLQRALRRGGLPAIGASTIRRVLHGPATASGAAAPGARRARQCAYAKQAWSPSTIRRPRRNSA